MSGMLSMRQMDLAAKILEVMNDLDNYPDYVPEDVLPEPYYDESGENVSWRFTADGTLQAIADATGDWTYAGHVSDEVWEYRTKPARGL